MEKLELQKIDELLIHQHSCLEPSDNCFFLGEFASRQGYQHSNMNQLIFNFKKPMSEKGLSGWGYKESAINYIAKLFIATSSWHKLKSYTWVSIPPSKIKTDKEYDDRLIKLLNKMSMDSGPIDIREMLIQKNNRDSAHLTAEARPTIEDHLNNVTINEDLCTPEPDNIILFDDVITTGASFSAASKILKIRFPTTTITGLFIARAISIPIF